MIWNNLFEPSNLYIRGHAQYEIEECHRQQCILGYHPFDAEKTPCFSRSSDPRNDKLKFSG